MERHPRSSAANRRSASSGSDLLQTKLRRLLNTEKDLMASDDILIPPPPKNYNDFYSSNQQSSHRSPKNYQKQLTVHAGVDSQNDVNVFFPSAFLSPQSLPPHPSEDLDVLYSYSINDDDEFLERPISPPMEYQTNTAPKKGKIKKEKQQRYERSHSQTMAAAADEYDHKPMRRSKQDAYSHAASNNINSHKSLPDLHTQISRHSPHSEYSSRGNRSNRSGSSGFNRDSGSSGHFTHRSEPCCKQMEKIMMNQQQSPNLPVQQEYRRDSGSSTQHSGNSYYAYQQQQFRYDCIECRAKLRENDTIFNFPVEVPEAFQDGYQESSDTLRNTYYNQQTTTSVIRSPSPISSSQDVLSPSSHKMELSPVSPPLGTFKRQKCLRFKNFRYTNSSNVAQTSTSQPNSLQVQSEEDRRPILRSKSDISDRYWNKAMQQQQMPTNEMSVKSRRERYQQTVSESFGSNGSGSAGGSSGGKLSKSDSMYELEHFFDQLGLDDKDYQDTIARPRMKHQRSASATVTTFSDNDSDRSSVVFFSDCSTIDSNRIIADSGPSTIQAGQTNPNLYRPSEPPSIVERNARIIKWLCNCKKSHLL
jgi:hypothetical protein